MKKRFMAFALASMMFACTGCVEINIQGTNSPSPAATTDPNATENPGSNGEDNNSDSQHQNHTLGTHEHDTTSNNEAKLTEGPQYILPYYEAEFGDINIGAHLTVTCEQIKILTPGYEKLQSVLNTADENALMWGFNTWTESEFDDYDGYSSAYRGMEWTDDTYYVIRRNDSQIFSTELVHEGYTGGAHPFQEGCAENYETLTGKVLTLHDVCKNYEDTRKFVMDYFTKLNSGKLSGYEDCENCLYEGWEDIVNEKFNNVESEYDEPEWFACEDSITIFFNPYEIAPWASGDMSVTIGLDDGLLKEEYFHKAGTAAKNTTPLDLYYSRDMVDAFMPYADKLGQWYYDDCYKYAESIGMDFFVEDPDNGETNGGVWVEDPELSGYFVMVRFAPKIPDTNSSKTNDVVHYVVYSNGYTIWTVTNNWNKEEVSYYIDDKNINKILKFKSKDDFFNYLGVAYR